MNIISRLIARFLTPQSAKNQRQLEAVLQQLPFEIDLLEKTAQALALDRSQPGFRLYPEELVVFKMRYVGTALLEIVRAHPDAIRCVPPIFVELNSYFECLWQIALLQRYRSAEEQSDLKSVYPRVQLVTLALLKRTIPPDGLLCMLMSSGIGEPIDAHFSVAVMEYINGIRQTPIMQTGSLFRDNVLTLVERLDRIAGFSAATRSQVDTILTRLSNKAFDEPLFIHFSLKEAISLPVPPSWIK